MRSHLTRLLVPLVTVCMGALFLPGAVSAQPGAGLTATEGSAFSGVVASFNPADVGASTCSGLNASVDWGDGSLTPGTVGGTAPSCTVSGTHTYADEGVFNLVVTVVGPLFSDYFGTAYVQDADDLIAGPPSPVPLSPIEGASFSGLVATFGDAYSGNVASDFTATIDWGDGTTTGGTVASPSAGLYDVSGSHTYAEEGLYSATVTLTDDGGGPTNPPGTASVTVEVSDALLTAAGTTLSVTSGQPLSATVATFTDADPGGVASDYAATIAWGDGATSTGTISAGSGSGFDVSGTHTYSSPGAETAIVTIQDAGGSSTTASTSVTVAAPPPPPSYTFSLTKGVAASQSGPFSASLSAATGSTVWYQLTLTNTSESGLVGLTLTDSATGNALPSSCSALPSPFNVNETYTCTYQGTVAAGTTTNTATATFGLTQVTASATVTGTGTSSSGGTTSSGGTNSSTPTLTDAIAPGVDRGTTGFTTSSVVLPAPGYVTYLVQLDPAYAGQHVAIYTESHDGAWVYTTGRIVAADGTVHYYAKIGAWTGFWAKLDGDTAHGRIGAVR